MLLGNHNAIRNLIGSGHIKQVKRSLGRPFSRSRFLSGCRRLDIVGVNPIDPNGHGFRVERSSQSIAAKIFMNIAFSQCVASMDSAALTHVKPIRDVVVVREFIARKSNVRRASFRLDVVEPTKVVVAKDSLNFHPLLPVGQHPARSIAGKITPPINSQQVELSVGNDRLGVRTPSVLGRIIVRRRFLNTVRMIGPAIVFSSETKSERLRPIVRLSRAVRKDSRLQRSRDAAKEIRVDAPGVRFFL